MPRPVKAKTGTPHVEVQALRLEPIYGRRLTDVNEPLQHRDVRSKYAE